MKGQTLIDENESRGLLLRVRTQEALNRAEEENIVRARLWAPRWPGEAASVEAGPAIGHSRVLCADASAGCEQGFPGSFVERIHPAQARDSVKPRVRADDCGYAVDQAGSCMYAIVGTEVWGAE